VYLDNNATTPLDPEVKEALREALELYANGSSMHEDGRKVGVAIEAAREKLAQLINAEPEEIVFTSGGSESNNSIFHLLRFEKDKGGLGAKGSLTSKRRVVSSVIEHPSVLGPLAQLEKEGFPVTLLPVDRYGLVDPASLEEALNDEVALVSIMLANNEIGTIQPLEKISEIVHSRGIPLHTDAVQGLGKMEVDAKKLGVDYLSCSAHKLYGPKGVGCLYIRKGSPFTPYLLGGHQEDGRRAGTYNSTGIIGFGKAAEKAERDMKKDAKRLSKLRDRLEEGIIKTVPDVTVNGHPKQRLPNTTNISFAGAEGESILLYLDLAGIDVSTGSACATGSLDPSHVLMATNIDPEYAHGSIRFSLGRMTTEEEIDRVLRVLPEIIGKIRKMSTRYTQ